MDWLLYAIVLPLALLALGLAGCALHWAAKHGQVRELWLTVRSMFGRPSEDPSHSELLPPPAPTSSRAHTHS